MSKMFTKMLSIMLHRIQEGKELDKYFGSVIEIGPIKTKIYK